MLERSVVMNGLSNVHIRPEAVTASSGVVRFYPISQYENEGLSSTIPGSGTVQESKMVPAVTLDDFLSELGDPRVDVIKIDVEGSERDVFSGMRHTLASQFAPSAILFESTVVSECADILRPNGYQVMGTYFSLGRGVEFIAIDDHESIHRVMKDFRGQFTLDYLALKEGDVIGSFDALAERSRRAIPRTYRFLSQWM
jgi:FkbM family methyltransferase